MGVNWCLMGYIVFKKQEVDTQTFEDAAAWFMNP